MNEEMNENEVGRKLTEEEKAQAEKKAQMDACAHTLRDAAAREQFLSLTELAEALEIEKDATRALLAEMNADESYKDICAYTGEKDVYYYCYPTLAHNYVKNSVMAQEDDLAHTIAEVVRYESKTYPRATDMDTFSKYPYHYTHAQVKRMLERMSKEEEYADLQTYVSGQKKEYIFSTKHLSARYAATLVEMSEDKRLWM